MHAGVDLIVAQNADVERMVRIGSDIEIRGVVLTEVDAVVQHAAAPQGAYQQKNGMFGGIVEVLLLLGNNSGHRALPVLRNIVDSRMAGRRIRGNFGITPDRIIRRRSRGNPLAKKPTLARHVAEAYGFENNVRGVRPDRDIAGDLRHTPPHLDGRKRQGFSSCRNRDLPDIAHRQVVIVFPVVEGQRRKLRLGSLPQISMSVGDDVQAVVARRALEAQTARRGVQMLCKGRVAPEEVEVRIGYAPFVRGAGYGLQRCRTQGKLDRNPRPQKLREGHVGLPASHRSHGKRSQ